MATKTGHIDLRVEPELVKRVDAWRNRQRVRPSRTAMFVYIITEFLEREEREEAVVQNFKVTKKAQRLRVLPGEGGS